MAPSRMSQGLAATLGLRQLILAGELRAGDRLSEVRLAARLGLSRTPIRLALGQLEHEGLLETGSGAGFVVRSFNSRQVADAIDLRGVLEGAAARRAAELGRGARALGDLIACVARLDHVIRRGRVEGDDFELYVELNARLHTELIVLSGSDALRDAYERALALPFAGPSAFVSMQVEREAWPGLMADAQSQHHGILDAIERGDGDRADAIAREHARLATGNLEAALRNEQALAKLPGSSLISVGPERPAA